MLTKQIWGQVLTDDKLTYSDDKLTDDPYLFFLLHLYFWLSVDGWHAEGHRGHDDEKLLFAPCLEISHILIQVNSDLKEDVDICTLKTRWRY